MTFLGQKRIEGLTLLFIPQVYFMLRQVVNFEDNEEMPLPFIFPTIRGVDNSFVVEDGR